MLELRKKGFTIVFVDLQSGKTEIVKRLVKNNKLFKRRNHTTRKPRPGEKHGVDYLFLSRISLMRREVKKYNRRNGVC